MLEFFRKYTIHIGLAILILFGGTMFSGAVFFGGGAISAPSGSSEVTDLSREIAVAGSLPISRSKFIEAQQQLFAQVMGTPLDPEIVELLQYNAFVQALRYSLLLKGAEEAEVTLTKQEIRQGLNNVYVQFDLKDKKALKKTLKENNYPYKHFLSNLKRELRVEKYTNSLKAEAEVNDQDINNRFKSVLVQHLLIKHRDDNPEHSLTTIQEIKSEIDNGMAFGKAVSTYSEDDALKSKNGLLGWVKYGETHLKFEDAAFSSTPNLVTGPIRTSFGYHLIKVLNTKTAPIPEDLDIEELRQETLAAQQERLVEDYLQHQLEMNPLTVLDPVLRAYKSKTEGRIQDALSAYQTQESLAPNSPVPHYLAGHVHRLNGDLKAAENEWEKALIKVDLNPTIDFPALHLALGTLYAGQLKTAKKDAAFERALTLSSQQPIHLQRLEKTFSKMGERRWLKKVTKRIAELEAEQAKQAAQNDAASVTPES